MEIFSKFSNINKPTLVSYLKAYLEGGVERLKEIKFYRPKSVLEDCEILSIDHFEVVVVFDW